MYVQTYVTGYIKPVVLGLHAGTYARTPRCAGQRDVDVQNSERARIEIQSLLGHVERATHHCAGAYLVHQPGTVSCI